MSYAPPTSSLEPVWAGEPNYRAPHANLPASWNSAQHYVGPAGVASHAELPPPSFAWDQFIAAQGFGDSVAALRAWALRQNTYRDPQHTVSASWVGAEGYGPPVYTFTATWAAITYITATGIPEEGVGDPVLIQTQFAAPEGWASSGFGDAWAIYPWEYAPPEWVLDVSWVGRPTYHGKDSQVEGHWTLPSESKAVPLVGWDSLVVSDGLNLKHSLEYLEPTGFNAALFGVAYLANKAAPLRPTGLAAGAYGRPEVWNWRTYRAIPGFNAQTFGEHFVGGGVKQVLPGGIAAPSVTKPTVVNTTANQNVRPNGIAAPAIVGPAVSPRTLIARGFLSTGFGTHFVQRNPAPKGFYASLYGTPAIEFKTKYLTPAGIDASESGFPRVFDPTRKLFVSSVVQAGVFGDTRIANRSFVVRVPGTDYAEIPAWHYVENNRRHLAAPGWNSAAYGALLIANKSPSIAPPGIDSLRIGSAAIGYSVRYITPAGINSMRLGAPVLTKTPEIAPKGMAGAMGIPTVWRRVRILEAKGHDSQRLGQLSIWFRYRLVSPSGGAMDRYGAGKVEHGRRTLLASGMQHATYGRPTVTNADRSIAPASIFENFASGHMVGGLRFLRPAGYEATRFGSRIIPEIQQVYPQGFAGQYGLATIFNFRKVITPAGITTGVQPADRWGTARAWNLRQYVFMSYDPDSALNPPAWPQWTKIENRTRVIRTSGRESLRIGDQQVDNKARPLYAQGIAAPSTPESYRAGMVAFRVRPFRLEGIEPPYLSTWASVRNTAAVLKPGGSVATLWGVPAVVNTRRTIDRIGGFDSAWYGYPMVAPRVRNLSFEGRYTIGAPLIPLPEVKLYTRYIEPAGYESFGQGWASLSIHWTIITPRWTHQDFFGWSTVRNLTPELQTGGRNAEEFGDISVRLEWRPVDPDGADMQLFGRSQIADRDRVIPIQGIRSLAFGDKLRVIRTGAPPYSEQTISLRRQSEDGDELDGFGIAPGGTQANIQVPIPTMNQLVVYVRQPNESTLFGVAYVTANTIRVEPGYWEQLVGDHLVALKIREVIAGPFPSNQIFQPSPARVDPHTIWATTDTPQQAVTNHPGSDRFRPVGQNRNGTWNKGVGSPRISLQHRSLRQTGNNSHTSYGRPTLINTRHYIRPDGIRSYRFGWHVIPGPQSVEQFDSAFTQLFGRPSVSRPPYVGPQTITGRGFAATLWGANEIQLLDRPIYPQGYQSERMGTRLVNDRPYMWQGLRVGPHVPLVIGGYANERLGEPWVSFRVREVALQGFDAFLSEYELEAFDKRMRVTRRAAPQPSRAIAPVGILATGFAASDVKPGVHFIRPDGNADQYRKGAF